MDAGRLELDYRWHAGRLSDVSGAIVRPDAARLLAGQPVARALTLVPRLYSLCGGAQAAVARAACSLALGQLQAGGTDGSACAQFAETRQLLAEAVQEHLWRIVLDWPQALGMAPDTALFTRWHKRLTAWGRGRDDQPLPDEFAAMLETNLLAGAEPVPAVGAQTSGLAGQLLGTLDDVLSPGLAPRLLAAMSAAEWASVMSEAPADFAQFPGLSGQACETGPLARHAAHPAVAERMRSGRLLAARVASRLLDLYDAARSLRAIGKGQAAGDAVARASVVAIKMDDGDGFAMLDTARGWLMHRVRAGSGSDGVERIETYQVIAPTEWNFHPQGTWLRELDGATALSAQSAELRVRQVLLSLDPCVAMRIRRRVANGDGDASPSEENQRA